MATASFFAATAPSVRSVPPRSCLGVAVCLNSNLPQSRVSLWGSAASSVNINDRMIWFHGKSFVGLHSQRRVLRRATNEEINTLKSQIEGDAKQRMEKAIENLRSNFNSVRTGRANPAILDRVQVEYYGAPVPLKSISQISTTDSSSLLVSPFDKSSLKTIEKAIVKSDLGLTPSNDGDVIRLSLPPLTSERRKELSKVVAKMAEEGKVAVRNIRRDALKAYNTLQKEKKLSEDNVKDLSSDLQKVTDEYVKKVDSVYKQKEQELLKL